MEMKYLQKIDELSTPDHCFLENSDECFFIFSYTSHKGFSYSDDNGLVSNLKKEMKYKGTGSWKYKDRAINTCAQRLRIVDVLNNISDDITIVPIAPSKIKSHPEYDDRLVQVLTKAYGKTVDVRELVLQRLSTEQDHYSERRQTIDEIFNNYYIDEKLVDGIKGTIIIFDDVITNGTHFKAMQRILKRRFPEKRIVGLFLARRIFPVQVPDFS